jgi:outer membrane protein OmpA-like peptidoglycan-associated protein
LYLTVANGRVLLTGPVPSVADRTALVTSVVAVAGAGAVDDRLTVDGRASGAGLAGLAAVVAALGPGAQATVELRGGHLTLSGTVPSNAAKAAAVEAAVKAVGAPAAVDSLAVGLPQSPAAQLAALPQVTFETGGATLTGQGRATLTRVAAILAANPTIRVRIEGHTDHSGTVRANLALSQARAETVRATLVTLGIAADRMTAVGFGATRPKVPERTTADRAINRRVEFVVG